MLFLTKLMKKAAIFFMLNAIITASYGEELTNGASPEVGKHVMANMDSGSMILSLLMVLALIVASALLLKKFNFVQQNSGQLKVVASLALGTKEKLVVVHIGEKQLILGVTSNQITLIDSGDEQLFISGNNSADLPDNLAKFFKQKSKTGGIN